MFKGGLFPHKNPAWQKQAQEERERREAHEQEQAQKKHYDGAVIGLIAVLAGTTLIFSK